MKKFFVSASVIVAFLLYSWHQKNESNKQQVTPSTTIPTTTSQKTTVSPTQILANPSPQPGQYKNGEYTGDVVDAFYGNVQVKAVIGGGKLTDVIFLQYPNDRSTSISINTQAIPYLKQEAIAAQNAQVDIVSGATDSSIAFRQSLSSALAQAKI